MKIKKYKINTGITLIALVISSIVLLILAGVSISILAGENGILTQAKDAKIKTEIAQVEEGLRLEYTNLLISKYTNGETAAFEQAIANYNLNNSNKLPVTTETVDGNLTINDVTLSTYSLQIGVNTSGSDHIGTISVTVDSSQGSSVKHFAQISGQKYEVKNNNGTIKVEKTPTVISNTQEVVIEATVTDETIATASVSGTVVTITGTEGNTTVNITVNGEPYNATVVAIASLMPGGTADTTKTDNYTDSTGKTATVPQGFTVSSVKTATEDETSIDKGLVIRKDSDEYVWIEVPRTGGPDYSAVASTTVNSNEYYSAIEAALIAYSGFAKTGSDNKTTRMGSKDEWYDSSSHTYDGTTWYNYDRQENASYNGNLEDTAGCGLTYEQYNMQYKRMLKSVYVNGGFWIGRYEASRGTNAPLSQANLEAEVNTCSQAQIKAAKVATSDATNIDCANYTSSLMFGIQWDLVCKFLESSTEWLDEHEASWYIKTDSTTWGVYSGQGGLKNTGVSGYKRMNIYDFAGNQWEWTLEHAIAYPAYPCARRGGGYVDSGLEFPASYRYYELVSYDFGFRVSLY